MKHPLDEHGNLTEEATILIRDQVIETAKRQNLSVTTWLIRNNLRCKPKRILQPRTWRVSYGLLLRLSRALGYASPEIFIKYMKKSESK